MKPERLIKAICYKGFSGNSSTLPRPIFSVVGKESHLQSLTTYGQPVSERVYKRP